MLSDIEAINPPRTIDKVVLREEDVEFFFPADQWDVGHWWKTIGGRTVRLQAYLYAERMEARPRRSK
jgi:hypothetical protein